MCEEQDAEERAALSEDTIGPQNIIAAYDSEGQEMQTNYWIMKKNLDKEDLEQYMAKIQEFAQDFFKHVHADKSDKDQSQKNTSTETKKRRHSTDRDDDDELGTKPARERVVKHRVTMEHVNPDNLAEFHEEFQQVYLDRDMSETEAEEELKIAKASFRLHAKVRMFTRTSTSVRLIP